MALLVYLGHRYRHSHLLALTSLIPCRPVRQRSRIRSRRWLDIDKVVHVDSGKVRNVTEFLGAGSAIDNGRKSKSSCTSQYCARRSCEIMINCEAIYESVGSAWVLPPLHERTPTILEAPVRNVSPALNDPSTLELLLLRDPDQSTASNIFGNPGVLSSWYVWIPS